MHYEDIWNLFISATPPDASAYYFAEVTVTDGKNRILWKANTYTFKISSSSLFITPPVLSSFEPVTVIFTEPSWYEKMTATGGMFPPGRYIFTYRLVQTTAGCTTAGQLIATSAIEKVIEALFPPSLLYPFNNDTIPSATPVFTWLPAIPLSYGITYTVRVSEINGRQSPEQSILNNRFFLNQFAGENTIIAYPSSAFPLHEGRCYAWEVVAAGESGVTGYSEVWSFTVAETKAPPPPRITPSIFLSLSSQPMPPCYSIDTSFIAFEYEEQYTDSDSRLTYMLRNDDSGKLIAEDELIPFAVSKGRNSYSFDISGFGQGTYTLEIKNEKNLKKYLRFRKR